jgi:hypothetical protein
MSKATKKKPAAKRTEAIKVTERPAKCPRCGCTKRTGKHRVGEPRRIAGKFPDGETYNHVQNFRADCANCGQKLAYNSYQTLPG